MMVLQNIYWCFTVDQLNKALASLQEDRRKEVREFLYSETAKTQKLRIEQAIVIKSSEKP